MALLFVRSYSRMTVFAWEIKIRKCSKKFVEEETNNFLNITDFECPLEEEELSC